MTEVFIVTSGEYSDYSIDAVFSHREMADAYVTARNTHGRSWSNPFANVEVWPLDLPAGKWKLTCVRMNRDGDTLKTWSDTSHGSYKEAGFVCWDVSDNLVWAVATDDEEHAVKVVNEKRTQILASDTWGKEPQ